MEVREIMANIVQIVGWEDSLESCAKIMRDYDIGCLVVGSKERLDGILTDRDIVSRGIASGKPLDQLTAADVMTPKPVTCRLDDTVNQAAFIMEKNQVRRLPVTDYDNSVVGIISLGDICTHAQVELAGELIEEVSKPEHRELAETG